MYNIFITKYSIFNIVTIKLTTSIIAIARFSICNIVIARHSIQNIGIVKYVICNVVIAMHSYMQYCYNEAFQQHQPLSLKLCHCLLGQIFGGFFTTKRPLSSMENPALLLMLLAFSNVQIW